MGLENFERFAGVVASTFGQPQRDIFNGDLVRSLEDLNSQPGGSRWARSTVVTIARQNSEQPPLRLPGPGSNREWPAVPRDHSRPRHRH